MNKKNKGNPPNVTVTFNNNGISLVECMKNVIKNKKISDKILN